MGSKNRSVPTREIKTERKVFGVIYFVGEYARQLDDRGRFVLPAKIRDKIEGTVYITRAPAENCLNLYTEKEWEIIAEKMRSLPVSIDENAARFQRALFSRAESCEVDKQGRIPLTEKLMNHAGLKKDIVLVGMNTKLEIWAADAWQAKQSDEDDIVLEGIMKYGINI